MPDERVARVTYVRERHESDAPYNVTIGGHSRATYAAVVARAGAYAPAPTGVTSKLRSYSSATRRRSSGVRSGLSGAAANSSSCSRL